MGLKFWCLLCLSYTLLPHNYSIYPKYLDKLGWANAIGPDQMLQNVTVDQDRPWLLFATHAAVLDKSKA